MQQHPGGMREGCSSTPRGSGHRSSPSDSAPGTGRASFKHLLKTLLPARPGSCGERDEGSTTPGPSPRPQILSVTDSAGILPSPGRGALDRARRGSSGHRHLPLASLGLVPCEAHKQHGHCHPSPAHLPQPLGFSPSRGAWFICSQITCIIF